MANLQWKPIQANYNPYTPQSVQVTNIVNTDVNPTQPRYSLQNIMDRASEFINKLPVQQSNIPVVPQEGSLLEATDRVYDTMIAGNHTLNAKVKYDQKYFNQYAPMIVSKAQKAEVNPADLLATAYIESKFDPTANGKNYGGLTQIDKRLHKNWSNPEYNIDEAIKLYKANQRFFKQNGINDWNAGYAYLAHQQGMGGAIALIKNPHMSAAEALQKTKQWGERSIDWINKNVVEANGGTAGMNAKDFMDLWTGKSNAYARHFDYLGQKQYGGWNNLAVKFRG